MSAAVEAPGAPGTPSDTIEKRHVTQVGWKAAGGLIVVGALFALLLVTVPREGDTRFALSRDADAIQIPVLEIPAMPLAWACLVIMALVAAFSVVRTQANRRTPIWVIVVFGVVFLVGFLAWAGAGSSGTLPIVSLLSGSLLAAVPLIYGSLSGVIGERSGVINIAIEGQMLAAAFTGAIAGSITGSPFAGVLAALLAGVLVALVLALFTVTHRVNQIIVGVVLNVLVLGLTSFFYSQVLVPNAATLNSAPRFSTWTIPLLNDIPVIGPVLFDQAPLIYLMYLVVAGVWFALYRTRWGLRLRAVGEHPKAADTVGVNVEGTRYRALLIGGACAGLGGAFYTTVAVGQFGLNMTAGAGFIALAAMIFGKWDPLRAAMAGLLFGFALNLQSILGVVGEVVPSQFMLMLPYVVTLFAVAGLVGRSRPPAANGQPYVKG
ncbi:ABC transporter permease [Myceligenerans pegani]|uniref:ABC transporter permease n=1 Tax=Myceligenerans pegani TaxID=2776917 RepID=A0ABR9N1E4_9MICO|nr:ABC transporter permease [Myceligenerans sp. TRM 65318]MBE1877106.1 ABC transporter permease [Myceligenerans sp. TRM 65318]MBE3019377.1 ABC transporter permease [Myceligenerans sp. TRM 65318]